MEVLVDLCKVPSNTKLDHNIHHTLPFITQRVRNLLNLKLANKTYLLARRYLQQTSQTPLTLASLSHELLCLHACRVVIVRRVQQGIAQA